MTWLRFTLVVCLNAVHPKTGDSNQIGSALYKPIGKTSCLSKNQDTMFIVGLNKTTANTSLVGFDTSIGNLVHEVVLPFSNIRTNGNPNASPAGVVCDNEKNIFVFGLEKVTGSLVGGFIDLHSHELRNKVTIGGTFGPNTYIHFTVATYSRALDEFIIGAVIHHSEQKFFAVNVKRSTSKEFSKGKFAEVSSLRSDENDGKILGTGLQFGCPDNKLKITLVSLNTTKLEFDVESTLQDCKYSDGPIGPISIDGTSVYWADREFLDKADIQSGDYQVVGKPGALLALEYIDNQDVVKGNKNRYLVPIYISLRIHRQLTSTNNKSCAHISVHTIGLHSIFSFMILLRMSLTGSQLYTTEVVHHELNNENFPVVLSIHVKKN